jgi:hypothetical protein
MNKEFKTVMEYLKSIRDEYLEALYEFRVYQALRRLRAPNLFPKEKAEKNAAVMTRFVNFFGPVERSLFLSSLLGLARVFDESDQSLHINSILNYIGGNRKKLTREDFYEFNQGRQFLSDLYENYEGMTEKDLLSIKANLEKHKDVLEKLKSYRDQYLAHSDKRKDEIKITFDEIETLFKLAEESLNLFTQKLNDSSTMYSHIEDQCMGDTESVLDFLDRFEPYRRKEIEKGL